MKLIEAYYMVSADLRRNADELLTVAEKLAQIADRASEKQVNTCTPHPEDTADCRYCGRAVAEHTRAT